MGRILPMWVRKLRGRLGNLDEKDERHRARVIMASAVAFFIGPEVKIFFGGASLAGLGVSIEPKQIFPLGWIVFAVLLYNLFAFWVRMLLAGGVDDEKVGERVLNGCVPDWNIPADPKSEEDMLSQRKDSALDWGRDWKFLWDVMFPSTLGLMAILFFVFSLFCQ